MRRTISYATLRRKFMIRMYTFVAAPNLFQFISFRYPEEKYVFMVGGSLKMLALCIN